MSEQSKADEPKEVPGKLEFFEGKLRKVAVRKVWVVPAYLFTGLALIFGLLTTLAYTAAAWFTSMSDGDGEGRR